jgi:hypothetical protein
MTKTSVKTITLTADDYLKILQDSSSDRPSAYWTLCEAFKIKDAVPELSIHAKDPKLGQKGDSPKALKHIEKHFGIDNVPTLFNSNWDT